MRFVIAKIDNTEPGDLVSQNAAIRSEVPWFMIGIHAHEGGADLASWEIRQTACRLPDFRLVPATLMHESAQTK